jgi:hypothetical protein
MANNKYNLRLEQLVQTNNFGNLLVSLSYDPEGPKIVSVYGGNIEQNLRQNLDTVLNLINFALLKKIKPRELAEQIRAKPQGYKNLPLDDLLEVVAQAMQDAPESVNQINPGILQELFVEAQRKAQKSNAPKPDDTQQPKQSPSQNQPEKPEQAQAAQDQSQNQTQQNQQGNQGRFFNPFRDNK